MNSKLAFLTFVAFLLTSCAGNAIRLATTVPAQFDLKRGSKISILYDGSLSDRITDYFIDMVLQDGYYHVVPSPQADFYIRFTDYISDISPNGIRKFECSIRQGSSYGALLWKKIFDTGDAPIMELLSRIEYTAQQCYNTLVPHEDSVVMYPKPSTPELEQAVKKCQEGNWETAKTLIQEAAAKHPEDPENYYLQAILNVKDMNYDTADDLLRKAYSMKQDKRYLQAIKNNAAMRHNDEAVIRQLSGE